MNIWVYENDQLKKIKPYALDLINKHSEYIKEQTLSKELFVNKENSFEFSFDVKIGDIDLKISFDVER